MIVSFGVSVVKCLDLNLDHDLRQRKAAQNLL